MDSKTPTKQSGPKTNEVEARRKFLTKIGKATATAPAVALLLAASAKSASAQSQYTPPSNGCGSA
ncbi:MAG: hypothetical protein ABL986_07355 [Vicinamibacterales bacterium]